MHKDNSIRVLLEQWSSAVGQSADPQVSVRVRMQRPYRVVLTNTQDHIDAAATWAFEQFGPIEGVWEETSSDLVNFSISFGPNGKIEPATMTTYFDFDRKDDAFAFKMRWG
jgi:hypothetical protein